MASARPCAISSMIEVGVSRLIRADVNGDTRIDSLDLQVLVNQLLGV